MHRSATGRSGRRRVAPALSALLAAGALAACSSAEMDVEGFAEGACTEVAGTLQDVDQTLRQVADEDITPDEAASRFEAAQERLRSAGGSPGGEVEEATSELADQLSSFRASVDTGSFDDEMAADVGTALQNVAQECRAG